jgi:predicted nucleic acid-binding protein
VRAYVDATVLIALGTIGELGLLETVPATSTILPAVREEVVDEPEATAVDRFCSRNDVVGRSPPEEYRRQARDVLGRDRGGEWDGDVAIVAATLQHDDADESVLVLSDDKPLRRIVTGFGASVSGTLGVVVYAVEEGMAADRALTVVDRIDESGLHLSRELRSRVEELVEEEARRRSDRE